uniref:DNA mismatch repair protein, putative n=2 Tax=Babesia bovis TaxID=5865 RepID=A7AS93_BABBO|eukprot:XP_001610980.1 DNA mismatch repair protein [Babesia bovis T2Bo]
MVVSCEMPNPLNKLTALALGLDQRDCSKESPKGLDRYMLPDNSQRYMKTYMLYMLSHLSDPNIAANVKYVVEKLATTQVSILYEAPITPNKIKCIVSQYKIDTVIMTELQHTLDAYLYYSRSLPNTIKKKIHVIAASDLNLASNIDKLTEDVEICQQVIRNVMHNNRIIPSTGIHALDELFQKEESTFNGMHPSYIVKELYQVDIAACQLIQAVATYFITVPEMAAIDITQPSKWRSYIATELQTHIANTESSNIVINDNYVIFKKITNVEHHKNLRSTEAVIDNQLITGYINNEVTQAMLNYRNRCSIAKYKAQQALSQRARILAKYAQNLVLASHCVVVVQTLAAHVSMATAKGWSHPNISPDRTIIYKNLIPHMDDQDEAIPLTVSLSGVNIIRGSNNSGKSTILSAILAATVAAQSGLYVPCSKGSNIPIYSNIMYHSFTRNKLPVDMSSVEYNVKSLTEILDSADEKSLVIIDELGSNMCDAYAKAVLSYVVDSLEQKKCTAIIATNTNADYITNPGCHHYKIVLEKNTITLVTNDSDRICFSFEFQNSKLLQQLVPLAQKTNDSTNTTLQVTLPDDLPMELHPAAELVLSSLGNMRICTNPKEIVHIYPNGMPPPMLNNAPVLYIMLIPLKESTNTCGNTTVHEPQEKIAIYVGESGNLELRLKAHRSKPVITLEKYMAMNFMNHDISTTTYMRNTMGCETQNSQYLCWAEAHTIVLKLTSRKDAKIAERRLIKRLYMKQSEVVLLSQRDGIYRELPCVD